MTGLTSGFGHYEHEQDDDVLASHAGFYRLAIAFVGAGPRGLPQLDHCNDHGVRSICASRSEFAARLLSPEEPDAMDRIQHLREGLLGDPDSFAQRYSRSMLHDPYKLYRYWTARTTLIDAPNDAPPEDGGNCSIDSGRLAVLELDGVPIGFCLYGLHCSCLEAIRRMDFQWSLEEIWIDRPWRRLGLGAALASVVGTDFGVFVRWVIDALPIPEQVSNTFNISFRTPAAACMGSFAGNVRSTAEVVLWSMPQRPAFDIPEAPPRRFSGEV